MKIYSICQTIPQSMKSVYYVALVTRAYRKALDALDNKISVSEAKPFVNELYEASHRAYGTGFYFGREDADVTVTGASDSPYQLVATIGPSLSAAQTNAVFTLAAELEKTRAQKYNSLCEPAKKAFDKAVLEHPDKNLSVVQPHGYDTGGRVWITISTLVWQ